MKYAAIAATAPPPPLLRHRRHRAAITPAAPLLAPVINLINRVGSQRRASPALIIQFAVVSIVSSYLFRERDTTSMKVMRYPGGATETGGELRRAWSTVAGVAVTAVGYSRRLLLRVSLIHRRALRDSLPTGSHCGAVYFQALSGTPPLRAHSGSLAAPQQRQVEERSPVLRVQCGANKAEPREIIN